MSDHLTALRAAGGEPADGRLRQAERAENFPVALRVLPEVIRGRLRAVYDVVRTIDDIGDEPLPHTDAASTDREARLDDLAADLERVWEPGRAPERAVLRRLIPVVDDCGLAPEPFRLLVAANRQDQVVAGYARHEDLLDYCALSAAPIGRLVLAVFGVPADPSLVRESDRVCAALQLLEHLQDVAEDRQRGRIYLPTEDLAAFGVAATDLDCPSASFALRRLVHHETKRAAAMLDAGAPLVGRLTGWARVAVAGYVAGGRAAADGLRRTGGDVLGHRARTRRRDVARHLVTALLTGRGRS